MICSKCNSEIPNGARFCTVCGAPYGTAADVMPSQPAPAPENKYFCQKCGLELQRGAKFCTVCGAPAANVGDVAPLNNDGAAFGNGNMSAVSLDKEPTSNDLVAAMNTAASAAAVPEPVPAPVAATSAPAVPEPVPAPVTAVPAPAVPEPVPAPVAAAPAPTVPEPVAAPTAAAPAPAAASYNNGFSSVPGAAPTAPEAPQFAPSGYAGGMQPANGDMNGLGAAVAVASAVPAKKKKGGLIALIIGIVVALILGGGAAFFFTNKATFLSTFMGKPKYAAMVEKDSLKKATEELDTKALSEQIKTVSSLVSALSNSNTMGSMMPSLGLSSTTASDAQFVKLMSSAGSMNGIDIAALLKDYGEIMKSQYGVSRIYGSMSVDLNINSDILNNILVNSDERELFDAVNGSKITYDYAATENMLGFDFGIDLNGSTLNAKIILEDDGTAYLVFPFVSDTGLKFEIPTANSGTVSSAADAALELDDAELKRLINEVVDIYTDYIKEASVTMEKGSLNVGGTLLEGKQIVADINGANLDGLAKAVIEHISNDSYFTNSIVSYIQSFVPGFTEADYKNAISEVINNINGSTENDKFIVTLIVNNKGETLAKSYAAKSGTESGFEIRFANNDAESAFEILVADETILSSNNKKTSDKDGVTTLTVGMGEGMSASVVVTYSGADKADFGNSQMPVGTYNIKLDLSNAGGIDADAMTYLNGLALDYTGAVDGGTARSTFGINIPQVGSISMSAEMTLSDDVSGFGTPNKVIDLTPILNGETPDEATSEDLFEYLMEVFGGLGDALDGTGLEDYINDIVEGMLTPDEPTTPIVPDDPTEPSRPVEPTEPTVPTTPGEPVDVDSITSAIDLEDAVWESLWEVYEWLDEYNVYIDEPYDNAMAYQDKFRDLDGRIWDVITDCTDEQLEAFKQEYKQILTERDAIRNALAAAAGVLPGNADDNTSGSMDGNTSGNSDANSNGGSNTSNTPNTSSAAAA